MSNSIYQVQSNRCIDISGLKLYIDVARVGWIRKNAGDQVWVREFIDYTNFTHLHQYERSEENRITATLNSDG